LSKNAGAFWLHRICDNVRPEDLRTARKALGLTQHGLAERLGMGKNGWQSVSEWETGKRPIPGPVAIAVNCLRHH
jgi:hypothetical protein